MTRRALLFISLAVVLAVIPLLAPIGCNDATTPQIQTIHKRDTAKDDLVEPPTPDEKKIALERLDKAIAAHGGPVQLRKLETHVEYWKGMILTNSFGFIPAELELKLQLPDRLRLKVDANAHKQHIMIAIDRANAWMAEAENSKEVLKMAQDVPVRVFQSLTEELHYRRIMTLVPLRENEFIIRPLDDKAIVNGKPTTAIRIGSKGHSSVNLYFDAESNLLVRSYHPVWIEDGRVQVRDVVLIDHKAFDGVKLPTKIVDKRDGVSWNDCTAEYKFPKEIDAKEFARP